MTASDASASESRVGPEERRIRQKEPAFRQTSGRAVRYGRGTRRADR